jgi:RNA polymerase sigma-70 factor (ECF subfamily)
LTLTRKTPQDEAVSDLVRTGPTETDPMGAALLRMPFCSTSDDGEWTREEWVRRDDARQRAWRSRAGELGAWLAAARRGDFVASGQLLEAFRLYLLAIADRVMPGILRAKCDGADLVQEALLDAHRGLARFRGVDVVDFRAWLRGILLHKLADWVRRYCDTDRRALGREQSLDAYLAKCARADEPVAREAAPFSCAIAREQAAVVGAALERLPAAEKEVVLCRYWDSLSFEEIGRRLKRSPEAARKLSSRALLRLQRLL